MSTDEGYRAYWSSEHKKIFIDLCLEEIKRGNRQGSNLGRSSWNAIIEGFFKKTGLKYSQKQFKNLWDGLKRSYVAWKKLLGQAGVEYDETTRLVTMEPERWKEYLRANPDAKQFRTSSLQFVDEMKIIYEGTIIQGGTRREPEKPILPAKLLGCSSQMVLDSQASQDDHHTPGSVPTTPSNTIHEDSEDSELAERPTLLSRKREAGKPSSLDFCSKREKRNMKTRVLIDLLQATLGNDSSPSIAECIKSLNEMQVITKENPLYFYALNIFKVKENREIWMALTDENVRFNWLTYLKG